jgi:hypothetical protein
LSRTFAKRRQTGRIDLETLEMALRAALHQAGTSALKELMQYPEANPDHRERPCPCGHTAPYQGLHSKTLVTVLGPVEIRRPYYCCEGCGQGPVPIDDELNVSQMRKSPGILRMLAAVGHDAPLERSCQQMKLLAGVEMTAKEVERTAEPVARA